VFTLPSASTKLEVWDSSEIIVLVSAANPGAATKTIITIQRIKDNAFFMINLQKFYHDLFCLLSSALTHIRKTGQTERQVAHYFA
jgi:hypothetical protein